MKLGSAIDTADVSGDGQVDLVLGAAAGGGPGDGRSTAGEVFVLLTRCLGDPIHGDERQNREFSHLSSPGGRPKK